MSKEIKAKRIKKVILEHSTYEELAEKTGISVSRGHLRKRKIKHAKA